MGRSDAITNQTLDRGLTALTVIASAAVGPTVDELAGRLGVHRSIAYRVVRTLEAHGLTYRDPAGRCHPGARLTELARGVRSTLQAAARPELATLSDELGMTAFLVVRVGDDAVTIESVEPKHTAAHVAYRPGTRHAVDRGAPGLALLAGSSELPGERPDVTLARQRGWAHSTGEVIPGLASVAGAVRAPDGTCAAAVACVFLASVGVELESIGARVGRAAANVTDALAGMPARRAG